MDTSSHNNILDIEVIDRDHREITGLLAEINFNVTRVGDPGQRIPSLRDLARATRSHFLLEEGIMAAAKYPGRLCTACGTNGCCSRLENWPSIGARRRMHSRASRWGSCGSRIPFIWRMRIGHMDFGCRGRAARASAIGC